MFKVQKKACATCIYRKDCNLDIKALEAQVADPRMKGFFSGFRECHHAPAGSGVCCRGFWNRHKDKFTAGQLAQRLKAVVFGLWEREDKGPSPVSIASDDGLIMLNMPEEAKVQEPCADDYAPIVDALFKGAPSFTVYYDGLPVCGRVVYK